MVESVQMSKLDFWVVCPYHWTVARQWWAFTAQLWPVNIILIMIHTVGLVAQSV